MHTSETFKIDEFTFLLNAKWRQEVNFDSMNIMFYIFSVNKTCTHTHTHTLVYIIFTEKMRFIYILSSTDRLFRSIKTLQYG